ncbi:hypothetical protein KA082_02190 [Candidatus Woesebacteria bacterium]|nr:hypothetical protein [Candidatus Woesebacteria bacterium]
MKRLAKFLHNRLFLICFLLFFASFFWHSWYGFTHLSFSQDYARDLLLTENSWNKKEWIISYGPKTSVGNFYLAPLYYQLYLLFWYFFPGGYSSMTWFIIFVESLTPVLLFLTLRKVFSEAISTVVSASYIFYFLPLVYASSPWNPNMIPFLSLACLYSYAQYFETKKKWYIVTGVLSVALAFQLHYQAVMLVPFVGCFFIYSLITDKSAWKAWLLAVSISLLTFIGYFVAEVNNHFMNTTLMVNYFFYQRTHYFDRISKPEFVFTYLPDLIDRIVMGYSKYFFFNLSIGRILFFCGFAYMSFLAYKHFHQQKRHLIYLLYFFLIFFMMRIYKGDKVDYYLSSLFILPAFLFAYLLKLHRIFIVVFIVALIFLSQKIIRTEHYNRYTELRHIIQGVDGKITDKSARVFIYNKDDINTLAYGMRKFSTFVIDQKDQDVIEVCRKNEHCAAVVYAPICEYSRQYSQLTQLKLDGGYKQNSTLALGEFVIAIGRLEKPAQLSGRFYHQSEYGSDSLLPELTEEW